MKNSLSRKKIVEPFANTCIDSPVLKVSIDSEDNYGHAVIDTGSETSIFDKEFVKKNREHFSLTYTNNKIELTGVANTTSVPIINANATITIGGIDIGIDGMIHDLSHLKITVVDNEEPYGHIVAVIGSDVLNKHKAHIDYDKRTITFML